MVDTLGRQPTLKELESSLEAHFTKLVRLMGGFSVKLAPTQKGLPDRLVFMPGGHMMLVELKADGGELSEAQRFWHQKVRDLGVNVVVLRGRLAVDTWARSGGGAIRGEQADRASGPKRRRKDAGTRVAR